MGGPLPVTFSNIYLTKLEKDQVKALKPKVCQRFDVTGRRLKNTHASLLKNLNDYHEKIKFTIEFNPQKFLDTRTLLENYVITTKFYCKRYKRNAIHRDLYRQWGISSNVYSA